MARSTAPFMDRRANKEEPQMTFPDDHIRGLERVEDHSAASIVIVSLVMIGAALASLTAVIV